MGEAPGGRELPGMEEPDWDAAGLAFAEFLITWREWVHRRVEVIRFEDETIARRSVSVDFTVPPIPAPFQTSQGPVHFVPITRLRKRTLTNFDLVDEGGRSLPMIARAQHRELVAHALLGLARIVYGDDAALEPQCRAITAQPPDRALVAARTLLARDQQQRWDGFEKLALALAHGFIVAVPLRAEPGMRRIVKFSYDQMIGDPPLSLREDLQRGSAMRSKPLWFPIPAMSDVPSYHLEVIAPAGLQITRRELVTSELPDQVQRRKGPYRRARFYHQPSEDCRGVATVNLRPQTPTIVRAAASLAWLTTSLLTVFSIVLFLGGFPERPGSASSLLLFVPGLLSLLLVRSGEHEMTTDMLWFLRVLTLASGGLAFTGGVAFSALSGRTALAIVLAVLAALSALPALLLLIAWKRCNLGSDPDRWETRDAYTFDAAVERA